MKKLVVSLTVFILSICGMISFSACFFIDGYQEEVQSKMTSLINAIQEEDRAKIKSLFASNRISNKEGFDSDIDTLIAYYNGEFTAYIDHAIYTDNDKDSGIVKKYYDITYDFTTTAEKYRMAVKWYVKDTSDSKNLGIWSLYIIKYEDDPSKDEHAYWGDGLWTDGIHIGTVYEGEW